VSTCPSCDQDRPRNVFVPAWGICLECLRTRNGKALSNYMVAMSERVVETPYGWANALCALGDPVEWLCWHIHRTRSEAEDCLVELVEEGRGRFPVR
jgi:hypothetical protein